MPLSDIAASRSTGRVFETGAYRDGEEGKIDYEGCLSPLVLERYGTYMLEHQRQSNGEMRGSDNWQKGIPPAQYVKSLIRHVIDLWKLHRGYPVVDKKTGQPVTMMNAACAILFNTMGVMHEALKPGILAAGAPRGPEQAYTRATLPVGHYAIPENEDGISWIEEFRTHFADCGPCLGSFARIKEAGFRRMP